MPVTAIRFTYEGEITIKKFKEETGLDWEDVLDDWYIKHNELHVRTKNLGGFTTVPLSVWTMTKYPKTITLIEERDNNG
jgi:hypothetical protein